MSAKIPDAVAEDMERLVNCTVHELVFFNHAIGDDDVQSAAEVLTTVQSNVERLADLLEPTKAT